MAVSVLASAQSGYSVSRGSTGDVAQLAVMTIPATTPSTSQPANLILLLVSDTPGSGNALPITFTNDVYHVNFNPADLSGAIGLKSTTADSFGLDNNNLTHMHMVTTFELTSPKVQLGGTLDLVVSVSNTATSGHAWFNDPSLSDSGVIEAMVLDPLPGVGLYSSWSSTVGSGNVRASATTFTIKDSLRPANEPQWTYHASLGTSSPTMTFPQGAAQVGSTQSGSAHGVSGGLAFGTSLGGAQVWATWSWTTATTSYMHYILRLATQSPYSAPPPYTLPVAPIAPSSWAAVIG